MVEINDAGNYLCRVENFAGIATQNIQINVGGIYFFYINVLL